MALLVLAAMPLLAAPGLGGYPAYTGKPVELQEWAWTSNENFSNDLFTKAHPDIKINWTNNGVPYAQLLTATAAGSGLPDVIMAEYTYAPQFMSYGSFQSINKWVPIDTYLK
jgi:multiple sugar transport system substrate-binding protein